MLKAEINNECTKLEILGDITDICTDITRIISAINERLSEKSPEVAHAFKVMFTTGFMDGICFDDDREHMDHYLAEGRELEKKHKDHNEKFEHLMGEFLKFLKSKQEADNEAE